MCAKTRSIYNGVCLNRMFCFYSGMLFTSSVQKKRRHVCLLHLSKCKCCVTIQDPLLGTDLLARFGDSSPIKHLSLRSMLPDTEHFMTYEGSTTHPGCWETTVWIILNKPIYITNRELYQLRRLMQGSEGAPKAPLGNNARPVQPLHQRTIRTNINFRNVENSNCPSMNKEMYYKANKWSPIVKEQYSFHTMHSLH